MIQPQYINGAAVRDLLREELKKTAQQIRENHRRAGQVASGRTLRSIRAEVLAADENQAHGVIWGRFPFGTLETGRRGADKGKPKVPENFEAIILQWMHDKGVRGSMQYRREWKTKNGERRSGVYTFKSQDDADRSAAATIARKIQKNGTKLNREGGRADIYSNVIPDAVARIEQKLGQLMSAEIDHINLNA